jgi:hypothetical protein
MSASARARPDDPSIELGSAVNWTPIFAAAAVGLAALAVAITSVVLTAPRAAPTSAPAVADSSAVLDRYNLPRVTGPVEPALPILAAPRPVAAVTRPAVLVTKPAAPAYVKECATAPTPAPAVAVYMPPEPPEPPKPVVQAIAAEPFKRRHGYNEELLLEHLVDFARELDIEHEKGTSAKLLAESKKAVPNGPAKPAADKEIPPAPILALVGSRPDLRGLPMRDLSDCRLGKADADVVQQISQRLRRVLGGRSRGSNSGISDSEQILRGEAIIPFLSSYASNDPRQSDTSMRILEQMLQVEPYPVRLQLVKMLAGNGAGVGRRKGDGAALARRAVFDLSPAVREAAVDALRGRPTKEYRPVLLEALRYPWPFVADHAAEALVALKDRGAAADLAALVDEPDPQAPRQDQNKKWLAPEMVRVNHLGNCLLCHAPSSSKDDPIRAVTPERGKRIPEVYYDRGSGDFVRADVTYLRQDFSVEEVVRDAKPWPNWQRFDYVIRQRELSADEVKRLTKKDVAKPASYPQREAVLWALRELTGQDMGDRGVDWMWGLLQDEALLGL